MTNEEILSQFNNLVSDTFSIAIDNAIPKKDISKWDHQLSLRAPQGTTRHTLIKVLPFKNQNKHTIKHSFYVKKNSNGLGGFYLPDVSKIGKHCLVSEAIKEMKGSSNPDTRALIQNFVPITEVMLRVLVLGDSKDGSLAGTVKYLACSAECATTICSLVSSNKAYADLDSPLSILLTTSGFKTMIETKPVPLASIAFNGAQLLKTSLATLVPLMEHLTQMPPIEEFGTQELTEKQLDNITNYLNSLKQR